MAVTLSTILNGITGLSFRTQVNDNFTALNNGKSDTTHTHTDYETSIATNTSDIGTINTTTIPAATARLDSLEAFHTYDYTNVANVTVTNDVYETVATLTTPTRDVGTYEIRMSQLYTLNSTTNSAFFRFRINGGSWVEVRREPKDNTDAIPMSYWRVLELGVAGAITVEVQSRKGNAADILTIAELNIAVDRKA